MAFSPPQGASRAASNPPLLRVPKDNALETAPETSSHTNSQHALPSIAHLPYEIIAEIIQTAVNPHATTFLSPDNTATNRTFFKGLRSVCKQWRNVAFATPSLWTTIWVDVDKYDIANIPSVICGIESYFGRSGPALPLNLGFQWQRDDALFCLCPHEVEHFPADGNENAWTRWMDLLWKYRTRWEEISFFTRVAYFQSFEVRLLKDLDNAAQGISSSNTWNTVFLQISLDELVDPHIADVTQRLGTDVHGTTKAVFSDAFPVLETINLNAQADALVVDGQTHLLMPHSNLRKLRLEVYENFNTYFDKLCVPYKGGFSRLKKLLFACPILDVTPVWEDGPVVDLPGLEILVVSCPPSFSMFARLRAPALKTLQIVTYVPPQPCANDLIVHLQKELASSFHHLVPFVRQCNTNLREFRLNTWFLKEEGALSQLMESLTSVEDLCIDTWFRDQSSTSNQGATGPAGMPGMDHSWTSFDTSEIKDAIHELQNSMYLPNLRKLCLHHQDDEEIPEPVKETIVEEDKLHDGILPEGTSERAALDAIPVEDSLDSAEDSGLLPEPGGAQAVSDAIAATVPTQIPPAHDLDTEAPFIRGSFSWWSLGSFITVSHQKRKSRRNGFRGFLSGKAGAAGGDDALHMMEKLKDDGVVIEKRPDCCVYW